MKWLGLSVLLVVAVYADTSDIKNVITGQQAFVSYKDQKPGVTRKITVADLPKPYATKGVSNGPDVVARPADAWPQAPHGFKVELYAEGLDLPREIKTAPNGDMFVAENDKGEVLVFRGISLDGKPLQKSTFATRSEEHTSELQSQFHL